MDKPPFDTNEFNADLQRVCLALLPTMQRLQSDFEQVYTWMQTEAAKHDMSIDEWLVTLQEIKLWCEDNNDG